MTTVVLLHGIPGSAATWHQVADLLEPHYEILAPDLLGFNGQSGASGDELLAPSQARHVLELLDRAGADRVAVVGHDFGGPVAAHLVAAAPERVAAFALFATNAFPDTPIPFPLSALGVPVLGPIAERLLFSRPSLAMMVRQGAGRPRPTFDLDHYLGNDHQHAAIRTIFASSLRRLHELYAPVEAALRTVTVPSLVGWGSRDPFFPVAIGRRTAELIGGKFRLYQDAGHFLPEERPDEVAVDLLKLLRRACVR